MPIMNPENTDLQQPIPKDTISNNGARSEHVLVTKPEQLKELYEGLKNSKIFAWDTETNGTFDRFKVEMVGASFAYGSKAYYVPVNHLEGEQLPIESVLDVMKDVLEDEYIEKICHNLKFDEMVVGRYGIDVKGFGHDTFVQAWLLNEASGTRGLKPLVKKYLGVHMETYEDVIESAPKKRGEQRNYSFAPVPLENALGYAADDAYYTLRLFHSLSQRLKEEGLWDAYSHIEGPITRVLRNVEARGVWIDQEAVDYADQRLPQIIEEVEASIYEQAGEVFNIGSPVQLGNILFGKLGIGNHVPRTKSGNYTTDKKTLERYAPKHQIVQDVLRRKKIQKTHSTFVKGTRESIKKDGRVHPQFKGTGTVTGRFSCVEPNLQQIETKEVEEIKIRDFFIPSEGFKFVVADYSQVELRIMAHLGKDEAMMDAFISGADFHEETAAKMSKIMGMEIERNKAKPVNFGIGYGRTEYSVSETLGCSMSDALKFINGWFDTFPGVRDYKKYVIKKARQDGFVRTITGRKRILPEIRSQVGFIRAKAERQAFNTKVQGSAADIIKMAMIALEPELLKMDSFMCIQIHDELVIEAPDHLADEVAPVVKHVMEHPFNGKNPLRLPLVAEPKIVEKWGDAKD